MINFNKYKLFLEKKGESLSQINPGSDEIAIKIEYSKDLIEIIRDLHLPILGGDILRLNNGVLEYTYDSWCCEKNIGENQDEFIKRSYIDSIEYLKNYSPQYYVVIVI